MFGSTERSGVEVEWDAVTEGVSCRACSIPNRGRAEPIGSYITTSTVEYHLRKVFVKLGVTSRTQLDQVDLPT